MSKVNPSLRERFAEADALRENGDLSAAKTILGQLHQEAPTNLAVLATFGHVCLNFGDLEEAILAFSAAVNLSPKLEAVSLGLFHSLWKLSRRDQAMEELARFQSVSDSADYSRIVREINSLPD